MPLNWTLKMVKMVNFVLCICDHNKKQNVPTEAPSAQGNNTPHQKAGGSRVCEQAVEGPR